MRAPKILATLTLGLAPAALWAQPTLTRGLSPSQAADYLMGVLIVMAMLGAFVFFARRFQQRQVLGGGGLRAVGSLPLGSKERLVLVDVAGERLLVGVSPGGVQLVHRIESTPEETVTPETGHWLRRTLGKDAS